MEKTALITGSTSGIGLHLAESFARAGYDLVINGIHADGNELAVSIQNQFKIKCFYHPANLLKSSDVNDLCEFAQAKLNSVSVLINCAGMQFVSPIENFPMDKWNDIINLNLTSVFLLCKNLWPKMKAQGFGRVINIASVHGLVASEFKSAYVASKHGLIGLTKALALEGAPLGITVNAICPGYVKTALVEGQIKDQALAHQMSESEVVEKILLSKHAVKKFVNLDTLSELAIMCAKKENQTLTGSILTVDGGWSAS